MADTTRSSLFGVDEDTALAMLGGAWGDVYDEIAVHEGLWTAHHQDAPDDELLTGATVDELNVAIRSDWLRRQSGPTGMPPS